MKMNKLLISLLVIIGLLNVLGFVGALRKRQHLTEGVVDEVALQVVQQMKAMRKVSIANFMDSEVQLNFAFKGDDWDLNDVRSLKPQQKAFAPYFMPGVLSVSHNNNAVSADISDTTKEYIFTVQSDGIMSIDVINAEVISV